MALPTQNSTASTASRASGSPPGSAMLGSLRVVVVIEPPASCQTSLSGTDVTGRDRPGIVPARRGAPGQAWGRSATGISDFGRIPAARAAQPLRCSGAEGAVAPQGVTGGTGNKPNPGGQ